MRGYTLVLGLLLSFLYSIAAFGQTDTLTFDNDEILVGEIKSLSRGVLKFETGYSDSDFQIEWSEVYRVVSSQTFLIALSDGRRLKGKIKSDDDIHLLIDGGVMPFIVELMDIVMLKPLDESFWDRFNASVDVGFNQTKANNLLQFNSRLKMGYLTEKWEINATYNNVFSRQDSVADISRTDANIQLNIFFAKDWFINFNNDFLQNDEQKLALRSTSRIGLGNYVVNSNTVYLALFAGAAFNNETYIENANPNRQTGEAYAGFELNLFDTGDISLLTNTIAYPNLTDQGRFRLDFKFDIKYDLPLDFYIKAGTTVNYDNRPVEGATDLDYVIQTGIGWEW